MSKPSSGANTHIWNVTLKVTVTSSIVTVTGLLHTRAVYSSSSLLCSPVFSCISRIPLTICLIWSSCSVDLKMITCHILSWYHRKSTCQSFRHCWRYPVGWWSAQSRSVDGAMITVTGADGYQIRVPHVPQPCYAHHRAKVKPRSKVCGVACYAPGAQTLQERTCAHPRLQLVVGERLDEVSQ